MRNLQFIVVLVAGACTGGSSQHEIKVLPIGAQGGTVPDGAFAYGQGRFHFTADTTLGSADFDGAPVSPIDEPPPTLGTGDYNITLSGTTYANTQSTASFLLDGSPSYLVVAGYFLYTGTDMQQHVDQTEVIVLESDFAPGATVALDGSDRIALFGTGLATADEPDVTGAAVTGSVTFTSGGVDMGDPITASVSGQFGPVDWDGGGGSGSGSGTGSITPGAYTLAIATSQVVCEGSLAGKEADFAGITASDLSFGGGAVNVTTTSSTASVDGTAIQTAFGATPLELDENNGLLAGFTDATGSGPDGTQLVGKYFVVDPSTATSSLIQSGVGAGYITSDNSGSCTVAFDATLTM